MRIPEPLFSLINPMVKLLLRSPLHVFWSGSLMLITFSGRHSGKEFTTPVRYVRSNDEVRCFTSATNQWWRNLRGGAEVRLLLSGVESTYYAEAISNNPEFIKSAVSEYLTEYPQDAAYHEIRLNSDRSLNEADLDAAAARAVVVRANAI